MLSVVNQLKEFGQVKSNAIMSKYTTFHIGGPVQFLVEVTETNKLVELLNFLVGEGVPYFILGGGSNLLWQDEAWEGVVIKLQTTHYQLQTATLEIGAGAPLALSVNLAVQNSLAGLEWAAGVPGTVGGAVRGNAGAMDSDTAQTLESVEVWRDGEVLTLSPEACKFGYRDSLFKHNQDVVLKARYALRPGDKKELMQKIQGYIKKRNGRYPPFPSAGSFFKNVNLTAWPQDAASLPAEFQATRQVPAGWINEQNGLKGFDAGGAMLSREHGNFIINPNKGTQADVLKIVEEVERRAYTRFGVELEPEVKIVD